MGKYVVEELLKTGKHEVTAISREDSTNEFPAGVRVVKVNYDDQDSLVKGLQGQEVLIITMSVTAPPDQSGKLVEAAAEANVRWIIPNEWGLSATDEQLGKDVFLGISQGKIRDLIKEKGKSSYIGIACGFWYEYSLAMSPITYGFDFKNKRVMFYDDGNANINTSTWPQCGRAVAKLLSLKILPEDENDKSPTLSQLRNNSCLISSFNISQKDMFDSVLRVTGDKASEWTTTNVSSRDRYKEGLEEFQQGKRMPGFPKLLYSRVFYPDGTGNFEARYTLHNDLLGLPKEDLDEFTKVAVEKARKDGQLGVE